MPLSYYNILSEWDLSIHLLYLPVTYYYVTDIYSSGSTHCFISLSGLGTVGLPVIFTQLICRRQVDVISTILKVKVTLEQNVSESNSNKTKLKVNRTKSLLIDNDLD